MFFCPSVRYEGGILSFCPSVINKGVGFYLPSLGEGLGVGVSLPSLEERLRVLAYASEQSSSGRASLGNEVGGGSSVLLSDMK